MEGGRKCAMQGPTIKGPMLPEFTVDANQLALQQVATVIFQGLKNSSHLHGKI